MSAESESTLYIDGVKKIDHGEFLVPLDRDMTAADGGRKGDLIGAKE